MQYSKLLTRFEHLRFLGSKFSTITIFCKKYSGIWEIRHLHLCDNDSYCMAKWNYDRRFSYPIRELNNGNYVYCYIMLIDYNNVHKALCKTILFNSLKKMKL